MCWMNRIYLSSRHQKPRVVQVAKMCTSLTFEHDECKVTLQDQLSHNEKLLLKLRELEESLQGKEKDLSFSQSAVCPFFSRASNSSCKEQQCILCLILHRHSFKHNF